MRYGILALFFGLWAVAAIVTGAVTQTSDLSAAGGSTQSYTDLGNNIFAGEESQIDAPIVSGNNPISAGRSFANTAVNWVKFLFNSATLQSPIWEGFAQPFRYAILALQLPLLLLVLIEGAKTLSGFVPLT